MEDKLHGGGTPPARKPLPPAEAGGIISCIFLIILSGILLFLAAVFFSGYLKWERRNNAAIVAEPIRLKVDLSKPGEYSGDFFQSCTFTCREFLRIETQRTFTSPEEAIALLGGLEGLLEFTDLSGKSIFKEKLSTCITSSPERKTGKYFPMLLYGRPFFSMGKYKLKLTIQHGASALSGIPCTLVARYELCGIEHLQAKGQGLISLVLSIMAGAMLWISKRELGS